VRGDSSLTDAQRAVIETLLPTTRAYRPSAAWTARPAGVTEQIFDLIGGDFLLRHAGWRCSVRGPMSVARGFVVNTWGRRMIAIRVQQRPDLATFAPKW